MFILENTDTFQEEFNNFPEITDWSNDSYNILEASLFFEEDISNIITEMAVSEVNAYHEGTIESFNEGAFETVKNKIKQLWAKFKALVEKVYDRFMAWIRKVFMSNDSFWSKYGNVIEDNASKVLRKNPEVKSFDFDGAQEQDKELNTFLTNIGKPNDMSSRSSIIDWYNDTIENLGEIKKEYAKALNDSRVTNAKDVLKFLNLPSLSKENYKKIEAGIKSGKDDLNKKIKKEENDIKTREKYTNAFSFYSLQKAKISKAVYTAQLDLWTKLIKKYVQVLTNVAYEAVKLQNTNEEDIKEESASIDLLNKYLQRI